MSDEKKSSEFPFAFHADVVFYCKDEHTVKRLGEAITALMKDASEMSGCPVDAKYAFMVKPGHEAGFVKEYGPAANTPTGSLN